MGASIEPHEEPRYVDYAIVPLFHLMQSLGNIPSLEERKIARTYFEGQLLGFECGVEDVNDFIHHQAWPLEWLRVCTTQLFVDESAYLRGELDILGFVTLMPTVAVVDLDEFADMPQSYSEKIRTWLDDFEVDERVVEMPAYEILQVATNERLERECGISMKREVLVREAERLLNKASDTVGGRFAFADVYDDMLQIFIDLGYRLVPDDEDKKGDAHAEVVEPEEGSSAVVEVEGGAEDSHRSRYLLVRSISEPLYQNDAEPDAVA